MLLFLNHEFISIYLPHNNRNYKNIRLVEKKWRGDLTETKGDYDRLGLLELRATAVYIM